MYNNKVTVIIKNRVKFYPLASHNNYLETVEYFGTKWRLIADGHNIEGVYDHGLDYNTVQCAMDKLELLDLATDNVICKDGLYYCCYPHHKFLRELVLEYKYRHYCDY